MLGIIVSAATQHEDFPNSILHRIGGKTVLERVLRAASGSALAHKIILCMPEQDKVIVHGHIFQDPSVNIGTISNFGRGVLPIFTGRPGETLSRLHQAATLEGLASIALISGTSVMLPTWLLNAAILQFYANQNVYLRLGQPEFSSGFEVEIIPYWMLAAAAINSDESNWRQYLQERFECAEVKNAGDILLPVVSEDLGFNNKSKIGLITKLIEEIDLGADLGDLLLDLKDKVYDQ
jgi:spore coat polysaccharide biosynthesis protein SpsF (cytidylyltransferase family)